MACNIVKTHCLRAYKKTTIRNPYNRQSNRGLNGFAITTLSKGTIIEEFYQVEKRGTGVKVNRVCTK